jgi:hypothetical protein
MTAPIACPSCAASMTPLTLDGHLGTHVVEAGLRLITGKRSA